MNFYDVEFALKATGQSGRAIVVSDSTKRAKELLKEKLKAASFPTSEQDNYDILYVDLPTKDEGVVIIGVS